MSFVFYDVETTGLSAAFDQIVQFAAIRTNDDLEEIERFEIRSRLSPYVLPSPAAMVVTGQTIRDLCSPARPSRYDMVCQIRARLLSWQPACFLGFNSLRYDEECLRQSFYQTLHPPYLTSSSGNGRGDVLHLMRAASALYPDVLTVPLDDGGKPSFRLDRLAPANGFEHTNAHDALADVEATIHLCRLVRDGCPSLWARFRSFTSKAEVESFLRHQDAAVLIETAQAGSRSYVVSAIGEHPSQPNIVYALDLSSDLEAIGKMSDDQLIAAQARPRRPIRRIKKNAPPTLCPLSEALGGMLDALTVGEHLACGRRVRSDRDLVRRLLAVAHAAEPTHLPSQHLERQLYDGFWSRADERRMEMFHQVPWEKRPAIIEEFADSRLVWLGWRLLWAERPEFLPTRHHARLAKESTDRLLADTAEWLTIPMARVALAKMSDETEASPVLDGFREYIDDHWVHLATL